jgi:hypothetical protein
VALAGAAFLASGAAALIYQVSWQRILALQSGVGLYSIAVIVASFMAGLGGGSLLGARLSVRLTPRRALRAFALVELGLGLFGAASCWIYYDWLYLRASWLYHPLWRATVLHVLGLLVPTTLMGMSLPFLVRAVVDRVDVAGRTIGLLYGLKVLGAAGGALATPWLLVPRGGLTGATWVAAAANLLASVAAALAVRGAEFTDTNENAMPGLSPGSSGSLRPWLMLYALSGFCALGLEMVWFRLVEVATKSTAFTFGTVLSVYLSGWALGSLIAAPFAPRLKHPLRAFLTCQCALIAYSAAAVVLLARLPPDTPFYGWFVRYWRSPIPAGLGRDWNASMVRLYVLLPAALFGPATLLMGASYPILQRAVQDDPRTSGRKAGSLQAANIAGSIAGSLIVGLLLLDLLGSPGTLRVLLGVGIVFATMGAARGGSRAFMAWALVLVGLAAALPTRAQLWLRLHGNASPGGLAGEDATGVVALLPEGPPQWRVFVGGRSHSWLPFGGTHTRLGAMPSIVHPIPTEIAVVGLGSGDTAWGAACRPETRQVTVFEIAGPQPRLLRTLAASPGDGGSLDDLRGLLADPRVRIELADGRNALEHGAARYDVIEADALPQDVAYSGTLYSLEFFRLCGRRLKSGGLMCSWTPTPRVEATFRQAFPHVLRFEGGIFIGSNERIPIDRDAWTARLGSKGVTGYLGEGVARLVLRKLRTGERLAPVVPADADLNHDLFPRDEFLVPPASSVRPQGR